MHDVVRGAGQTIQLTVWPEDFIIRPDPAPGGPGPQPARPRWPRDVLIVAALPDPAGPDRGDESVTLLNTSAAAVDLAGWALADAAGGRHARRQHRGRRHPAGAPDRRRAARQPGRHRPPVRRPGERRRPGRLPAQPGARRSHDRRRTVGAGNDTRRLHGRHDVGAPLRDHDDAYASCQVYAEAEQGWWCFGCARGGRIYYLASLLAAGRGGRGCAARRRGLIAAAVLVSIPRRGTKAWHCRSLREGRL